MQNFWHAYKNDTTATTAVEFALVGTTLILLLLSVVELGRFFFTWSSLQYAMEQATRYALVNEDAPISDVESYAISQMPPVLVNVNNLSIDIAYTNVSDVDFIELTGTYNYNMLSPVLPKGLLIDTDLRATTRMPVP
jgi:Flp pilus assembly protein TadG